MLLGATGPNVRFRVVFLGHNLILPIFATSSDNNFKYFHTYSCKGKKVSKKLKQWAKNPNKSKKRNFEKENTWYKFVHKRFWGRKGVIFLEQIKKYGDWSYAGTGDVLVFISYFFSNHYNICNTKMMQHL